VRAKGNRLPLTEALRALIIHLQAFLFLALCAAQ
jgi:hypothetical protein